MRSEIQQRDDRHSKLLTINDVAELVAAARQCPRTGHRDTALIFMMFQHALWVEDVRLLQWSQIDFAEQSIKVIRSARHINSRQPLPPEEIELLQQLKIHSPSDSYLFVTKSNQPLSPYQVRTIVKRSAETANLSKAVTPEVIRRSLAPTLYALGKNIGQIQYYLGHRQLANTLRSL